MKKRWTEAHWRAHNRARAEDSLARRLQWKEWKRQAERDRQGFGTPRRVRGVHHRNPLVFNAPDILSLVDAPDSSVAFFRRLQTHTKHRDVFIDLSDVRVITPDAIALLLAIVRLLGTKRQVGVSGNYPGTRLAIDTIRESWFDEYIKTSLPAIGGAKGAIVRQDLSLNATLADGDYARQLVDFAAEDGAKRC